MNWYGNHSWKDYLKTMSRNFKLRGDFLVFFFFWLEVGTYKLWLWVKHSIIIILLLLNPLLILIRILYGDSTFVFLVYDIHSLNLQLYSYGCITCACREGDCSYGYRLQMLCKCQTLLTYSHALKSLLLMLLSLHNHI